MELIKTYMDWSASCWHVEHYRYNHTDYVFINGRDQQPILKIMNEMDRILRYWREFRFQRNPHNYKREVTAPPDRFTEDEIQELHECLKAILIDTGHNQLPLLATNVESVLAQSSHE